jgi:hypothetical protein
MAGRGSRNSPAFNPRIGAIAVIRDRLNRRRAAGLLRAKPAFSASCWPESL